MYRKLINNEFVYYSNNRKISNIHILNRIKKLCIPPMWTNVYVSDSDTDYLQVTGYDTKGRIQYIYHPAWNTLSEIDKYSRLIKFSKKLPKFMNIVNNYLNMNYTNKITKELIIFLLFRLLYKTHLRIGNDCFAQENNTYGLTTLQKKHVTIKDNAITFSFIGKKGVPQCVTFRDTISASIISRLLKIPGSHLFKSNVSELITSNDINEYIKRYFGNEYSAKDFRTYAANNLYIKYLKQMDIPINQTQLKKTILLAYDKVAKDLGHTRTVCRNSYIISNISDIYIKNPVEFNKKTFIEILNESSNYQVT